MSIEAMAMAGMDYEECGISLEEHWDPPFAEAEQTPLCLQVHRNEFVHDDALKAKLREWAKAVVASCSSNPSNNRSQYFISHMRNARHMSLAS